LQRHGASGGRGRQVDRDAIADRYRAVHIVGHCRRRAVHGPGR
jgi:hypothetical protein